MEKQSPSLKYLLRIHLVLGMLVTLPLLAWSASGFFLALPTGSVSGQAYRMIDFDSVKLTPAQAKTALESELGRPVTTSSLTIEQRGPAPRYSAFVAGKTYWVDAKHGSISQPPPPSPMTQWVRDAHFFNFAGPFRNGFLIGFSLLAFLSSLSGMLLLSLNLKRNVKMLASP